MRSWCPRCGHDLAPDPELPCDSCWDRRADEELARLLLRRCDEDEDPRRARALLSSLYDARAGVVLRSALDRPDPYLREGVLRALGGSGGRGDVPAVVRMLGDEADIVRTRARLALAELGGPEAREALFRDSLAADEEGRLEATLALAWLDDPRALPHLRALASTGLGVTVQRPPFDHRFGVAWGLVRLGGAQDRAELIERMVGPELARRGGSGSSVLGQMDAANVARQVLTALRADYPDEADAAFARLAEEAPRLARQLQRLGPGRSVRTNEPVAERRVPRLDLTALSRDPPGSAWPPAKFGGLPDWVGDPAWPVTSQGRPLVFYGQLPLFGDPPRTAYIFINKSDDAWSFQARGEGNAVIVRPGGPPDLPTVEKGTGPRLFEREGDEDRFVNRSRATPYERFVELTQGADPTEWEWPAPTPDELPRDGHGDWNKIGGTPLFLQGEEFPPGEDWRFAFQFTAGWAAEEMGDGAQCYGFVRGDGTGAFLWQCH